MTSLAEARVPSNVNLLHPNKFELHFDTFPNLQFFAQAITVPGISTSEIPVFTPFVELYSPGDKAVFDVFNVTFIVDEDMKSWREVFNWIKGMTFPENFTQYENIKDLRPFPPAVSRKGNQQVFSDAHLTVFTSSNTKNIKFKFYDVFPTSLSPLIMSSSDSPDNVVTADATFRMSYFHMI